MPQHPRSPEPGWPTGLTTRTTGPIQPNTAPPHAVTRPAPPPRHTGPAHPAQHSGAFPAQVSPHAVTRPVHPSPHAVTRPVPPANPHPGLVLAAATSVRHTQPRPVAPTPPPPAAPSTARRLQLPALRILCWQLAAISTVLAIGRPWPLATALGVSAALLALTAIRVRGRWLTTLLATRIRHTLRRRDHDLGAPEHDPAALLTLLAPATRARTATIGGVPAGLLSHPDELVVVLQPRAADSEFLRAAAAGALLPDPDPDMPEFGARLVVHTGPVRDRPPRTWLAVRALRDPDICRDEDLTTALANTVRRVLRRLTRAGLPADALSEEDLRAVLPALTHTGSGRGETREDWRFWRAGAVAQAGFRLAGFAELSTSDRGPLLERLLATAPGVAITVAVSTGEDREPTAVLRIAATNGAVVDAAAADLTYLGERLGVRLERLDGHHARALAATMPIGGNPL
ncbi:MULTISPECIES: type VII secretion protein EccE [unclassified Crossiella]|uniref:type VII secretion protein EccE n=1 Tax=unclassified Crossiella TaxID=2620835 RepID=UPI001FFF4F5E|nr:MULTISPECIES: type VII secretion protein EccE [unclassified Crossiella]MCK2242478.1 type VII secretion protein EccE [Crossiella sp. S99.2]MCK2254492.1 type VII secretion protein EccE [Crossiella sp. S99.1]